MGDDPKIIDTRKETNKHPEIFMAQAIMTSTPDAIERQEAKGQQELCRSSQLPTEGLEKEVAEKMGIKIIGITEGDPLFTDVELPEGWEKKATEHSMHNDLVDDKGCIRPVFFTKRLFMTGRQISISGVDSRSNESMRKVPM